MTNKIIFSEKDVQIFIDVVVNSPEPNEELKIAKQKYHAIIDDKLPSKITRLEVINHAVNDKPIGRILTLYKALEDFKNIEVSYQDGGRTLKIFLD